MGGDYAMRIWMNPQKMAQYQLVPADVIALLDDQNVEAATGTLGEDSENTFQYTLKYRGRYETAEEFGNMVLKSLPTGEVLRLKDVADVELGSQSYAYNSEIVGHPGATCMISQTAGSNANEIVKEVDKLMEEISKDLPKGLVMADLMSTKDFLDASVHEVVKTLIEAIILVVLVVYFFLQSVRSTIIPSVSIIVSLVGTFAFLYVAGFSLNLLTLFALVLVIGTVVDDAIVVVEAVQAKFDEGYRGCYGWYFCSHCDHLTGIYGCVYPDLVHGRNQWGVLYPVWFDHGGGSRYFRNQCLDPQSGFVCPHHDSSHG